MPIYKMKGTKDGKQKYRVRINYVDALGVPRQIDRVTYGSPEAKTLEQKLNQDLRNEPPTRNMTVRVLYEEYISAKRHEVRESSLGKTVTAINNHILPTMGDKKIDKLTPPILQDWKLSIENKNLGIATRQNIYGEFRALLNYAVKLEYLPKNPLLKVGNFKNTTEPKKVMGFYTADEFKKFISVAKDRAETSGILFDWHFYVFFAIGFYTGLRKGEIHGLQWHDIDGNHLHVRRSIAQKLKGEDRITPPKNKSSTRTLQMPRPLITILETHKRRCMSIDGFHDENFICGIVRPLRDTTIQKRNEQYATIAELKTIRIHDFRHSHVSLLANEGINIQEIARRLGHSKIEITWNTYAHLYPREEEKAVAVLDKV